MKKGEESKYFGRVEKREKGMVVREKKMKKGGFIGGEEREHHGHQENQRE